MSRILPLPVPQSVLRRRKPGYEEAILSIAKLNRDRTLAELTDEQYAQIAVQFALENSRPILPPGRDASPRRPGDSANAVKPLSAGEVYCDPEQHAARQRQCQACDQFANNCCKKISNCQGGLPRRWRLKNAFCPLQKW